MNSEINVTVTQNGEVALTHLACTRLLVAPKSSVGAALLRKLGCEALC